MADYVGRIWRSRHFCLALVKADLDHRYRGSVLGIGWSLVHPLAMTVLICCMFSGVFGVDSWRLAPHVLIGLAVWDFLTACALRGCLAFRFAEGYIRQVKLPLAIYSLRTTISAAIHFLMAALPAALVAALAEGFQPIAIVILVLPAVGLLFVLGWAVGTVLAFYSVRFSDAPHLLEILLKFLFYATPVIYPASLMIRHGRSWVVTGNPMHHFLELFRQPLIEHSAPSLANFGVAIGVTALLIALAIATVSRNEDRLVFQL